MTLPILETPKYDLIIPSTNQKVKYRPWKIGEEKVLLIAMESNNLQEIVDATKQIISNCTEGKIDPEKLASFDIEYFFLEMRKRARGNIATMLASCPRQKEDEKGNPVFDEGLPVFCGKKLEIKYDLNELKINGNPPDTLIKITETVSIKMKYPGLELLKQILGQPGEVDTLAKELDVAFNSIVACMESIIEGDTVHLKEDYKEEDLKSWLMQMDDEQFTKFNDFFNTLPKIEGQLKYTCPCGKYQIDEKIEGMRNFFF